MDPRDCKVLHYGNCQGMGLIAVKVVALLASGMRIFYFPKNADQKTKEQAKRAKDQLTTAQVSQVGSAYSCSTQHARRTVHVLCAQFTCAKSTSPVLTQHNL